MIVIKDNDTVRILTPGSNPAQLLIFLRLLNCQYLINTKSMQNIDKKRRINLERALFTSKTKG